MQILIVIITLMVIIIGLILNRIALYSIRKNTERAKDIATIMQHTLNENNYVIRLNLKTRLASNLFGNFLSGDGISYEESLVETSFSLFPLIQRDRNYDVIVPVPSGILELVPHYLCDVSRDIPFLIIFEREYQCSLIDPVLTASHRLHAIDI